MISATEQFRDAIRAAGLKPPDMIKADGKLHRFASNGKRGDDAGWFILHDDGIAAGAFGDWRTGINETWRADIGRKLTPGEEAAHRATIEAAKCEREAEEARRKFEARKRATAIWKAAQPATEDHPYLKRKGIKPHGLRVHQDALVVPMRDATGDLHSLQFIELDGGKRFLTGGRVSGCYFGIGKPNGTICVVEGYATGASVHEASGHAVAVAFNAGNLEAVARALRAKFPQATIILCADDDTAIAGNPGITKATEAARVVGGLLAVPDFGEGRPEDASDFNDLARLRGPEAVNRAIEGAQAPAGAIEATEWPEPLPLPEGLPPVAPFDFALLPETLQPWARDICDRVQCPPDYVGATIMAALGSVIGRKVGIRPQAQTDWTEYPNQWALIVGRPGVLKSPAMEAALSPLKRLAAKAAESHDAAIEKYRQTARLAKLRAEASEKAARDKLRKNPGADVSGDLIDEETQAPTLQRFVANDTSAESLCELLRQNTNGLLVFRDELVSLLKGLDREESAAARGFYLTGWNGNSPYTFDRIGRGLNLHIPAVCISMLGSTQPGRIAEYLRAAVRGGAGDDGLIQRFGFLVWPDTGGAWRDVDRWPDSEARHKANAVFEALDRLDAEGIGANKDEFADVPFLRFDAEALELFREWRGGWEAKLRAGDLHPALESHLAKYRKLVPGLALILHLANGATGPVTKRATLRALAWAEYLETHARRAYASVISPEVAAAKAIIAKLRSDELARTFAARDIYRRGWAHLSEREQVMDALRLLVDLDRLAVEVRETEGRTATVYEANPRGLEA